MNFLRKKEKEKKKKEEEDNKEVFLDHKTRKTWEDAKNGRKCFMLYARSLYVTWGGREYWIWNSFKDTNEENIEVAKLSHVCWLDVRGKFKMSELSPATLYEVVYEIKLTKGASGWELPVKLRLYPLPDGGGDQERHVSLLEKPRGKWIELSLGSFRTPEKEEDAAGEICFDLYQHGGHWKNGLLVRGAIKPEPLATSYDLFNYYSPFRLLTLVLTTFHTFVLCICGYYFSYSINKHLGVH